MEQDLFSIIEANVYLKEGRTIKCVTAPFMNYFRLVDDKVRVSNTNTKYFLSLEEFNQLYKSCYFLLQESKDEENVDTKKDEEYYGWTHK